MGDAELGTYLQKALGYALSGDTSEECFFVLYGPKSRNGKSTLMETIMHIMGDYGKSVQPETIGKRHTSGSSPNEDIARLVGARLVNIAEPDKQLVLSVATVKTLTGNDTITARFLHENSFAFKPQFKMFVNTNHLPRATDNTIFASGRVKVIPFERHFSPTEQDKTLKITLTKPQHLSGILNWLIQGYNLFQAQRLVPPPVVEQATAEYRQDNVCLQVKHIIGGPRPGPEPPYELTPVLSHHLPGQRLGDAKFPRNLLHGLALRTSKLFGALHIRLIRCLGDAGEQEVFQ